MLSAPYSEAYLQMIMSILWMIWKAHNDFLFHKKSWSAKKVFFAASALLVSGKEDAQFFGNMCHNTLENSNLAFS